MSRYKRITQTRPDLVTINVNKEKLPMDFAVPANYGVKLMEIEKRDKYLDLARELKKAVRQESGDDTNCNGLIWKNQ